MVRSQLLQGVPGIIEAPALVGIDAQDDVIADGGADLFDAFDIIAYGLSQLYFDHADAVLNEFNGFFGHVLRCGNADGQIGFDGLFLSAEKLVEGLAGCFCSKIV